MKMFTNYLQILGALASFNMNMDTSFIEYVNGAGNPSSQMGYFIDLFILYQIFSGLFSCANAR